VGGQGIKTRYPGFTESGESDYNVEIKDRERGKIRIKRLLFPLLHRGRIRADHDEPEMKLPGILRRNRKV